LKVLHYKSNFLNYSETFIYRIIANHKRFNPVGMCVDKRHFTNKIPVYQKPVEGFSGLVNTIYFHLNGCLPFYNETIQKVKPDIIHAHFGFDGYRMIKPALKNNIPLITSFYGSDVSRLPQEFDWKRRYKKLAKNGNAFIAISDYMKQQLIQLGFPENKIVVIRFGLDLSKFSFQPHYSTPRNIMMVGRMVEKKAFGDAIKAINQLRNENFNVQLDLYGDGELKEALKKMAADLNLNRLITFHGRLTPEEIRAEYKKHSMLLVPSKTAADGDQEGLPNVILEAMACGTPVIAANHAAAGEVLEHKQNGLLLEKGNYTALANAIKSIKNEEINLQNIRHKARKKIEQNYEINDKIMSLEKLYKRTIEDFSGQ